MVQALGEGGKNPEDAANDYMEKAELDSRDKNRRIFQKYGIQVFD